ARMSGAKRPPASAVASAPARVTRGGEPPRRGAWAGLLAGFLVGLLVASVGQAYFGPELARRLGLAVPIAQAGAGSSDARPRPSRPTPEISSVLDIVVLWQRGDAIEAENR